MICPGCQRLNEELAEHCFFCGRALDALTQGVVLSGRWEVLRPIGKGGMGRVYKAHDKALEEDVAIKVLRHQLVKDPEMARRFKSEIKLARKVSHPNVCRIHDYGEDQGLLFISMEFIDGPGLKQRLQKPPSVDEAFEMVLQIARGLGAVHGHGIIHRDFKASNIMVDQKGVVKLMDFGIAKDAFADTTGVTREGQVMGTPEYMSPEQAGGQKLDFRSDIYSLGCVVFEIFTGDAPFRGSSPLATLYRHASEEPRLDHPALPEPLRPVLARALAKEPEGRYASVADFVAALEKARAKLGPELALQPLPRPVRASPPPTSTLDESRPLLLPLPADAAPTPRAQAPASPRDRVWPGALLGLLIAVAVGFVALRERPPQPEPVRGPRVVPTRAARPATAPTPTSTPSPIPDSTPAPSLRARPAMSTLSPPSVTPQPTQAAPSVAAPVTTPAPPVTSAAAAPATQPAAPDRGNLKLIVSPAAEVTVDGVSLGSVSLRELSLTPGRHVVRVVHPEYHPLQRVVTVRAGIEFPLVIDLREKGIRKTR